MKIEINDGDTPIEIEVRRQAEKPLTQDELRQRVAKLHQQLDQMFGPETSDEKA